MNKHIQRYSKTLGFVLLFFSILFLTACKIDDPQQITINLTAPVEIQNNAIVSTKSQSNTKEIIEINSHCSKYNCVLALLFSEKDGGLNQNKELNTYITMTFIDSLDDKTIQNIISDLEQLDVVETAYQAPKGEDAGMSLPEY